MDDPRIEGVKAVRGLQVIDGWHFPVLSQEQSCEGYVGLRTGGFDGDGLAVPQLCPVDIIAGWHG